MDSHETKIYAAILIAAGVLGILVFYFIISIIRNQRRYLKIQQANLLLEITALENERKRIVSDLHDELGPLLSVVKFQISSLDTQHEEDLLLIEKANNNLDDILSRIRDICNELMPQVLVRKGLIMAIAEFLSDLDSRTPIKMNFHHNRVKVPSQTEVHLYRMIQEIVNNAVKHSGASRLDIHLFEKESRLVITVSDNGKGFDSEKAIRDSKGLGLKNVLSRVDILRGEVYLASDSRTGTTYTIEIPKS